MAFKLYTDKSSLDQNYSRQVVGGTMDVDTNGLFLGWWEKKAILKDSSTDIEFNIPSDLAFRADKISYRVYGRDDLAWLVLQYNNIVDIVEELYAGATIVVPGYDRVFYSILVNNG